MVNRYTPFEFASLRFAEFWFCDERRCHVGLWSNDSEEILKALRRAVAYFRVARNLPKSQDEGRDMRRFEPLVPLIEHARTLNPADADIVDVVTSTMIKINEIYGFKALSLASKLLWLLHKDPFIVYDNQARITLGTVEGDYASFIRNWQREFELHRHEIQAVSSKLANLRLYLRCGTGLSNSDLKDVVEQEWFWKRVFDIWLWAEGAPRIRESVNGQV